LFPVQLLQFLHARRAKAIGVKGFYKMKLRFRQLYMAALALHDTTHLAFEGTAATWAIFLFMAAHRQKIYGS
jgi:hypothetical protein